MNHSQRLVWGSESHPQEDRDGRGWQNFSAEKPAWNATEICWSSFMTFAWKKACREHVTSQLWGVTTWVTAFFLFLCCNMTFTYIGAAGLPSMWSLEVTLEGVLMGVSCSQNPQPPSNHCFHLSPQVSFWTSWSRIFVALGSRSSFFSLLCTACMNMPIYHSNITEHWHHLFRAGHWWTELLRTFLFVSVEHIPRLEMQGHQVTSFCLASVNPASLPTSNVWRLRFLHTIVNTRHFVSLLAILVGVK